MALLKHYRSGVDRARFYRDFCREAAEMPKYEPIREDLKRWALMWDSMAMQIESYIQRIAESRQPLSRIEKQLKL